MMVKRKVPSRGWLNGAMVLVLLFCFVHASASDESRRRVVSRDLPSRQLTSPGPAAVPPAVNSGPPAESLPREPEWVSGDAAVYLPGGRPVPMAAEAAEIPTLFDLDWTHAQMHRGGYDSAVQFHLPGRVASPCALTWQIRGVPPPAGSGTNLRFRQDVFGRSGDAYGSDIPLSWDISVDGGPYVPLARDGDTCLTTFFPPGSHTFELRLLGHAPAGRPYAPGYYLLQLGHMLVPEL